MNRWLRRISLIRAWCPKVNRLVLPLQAGKTVLHRSLFVAGVFLVVLWGLMFLASGNTFGPGWPGERTEVVYAVANQTSREVFLKLRGDWSSFAHLEEVRVNGSKVQAGDPLPILGEAGLNYKTYAFRYDGPWEDSILITFYTHGLALSEQLVDLRAASRNSMEGLNPTVFELLEVYLRRHSDDVRETILYGSIIMLLPAAVVVSILPLLRGRIKTEPTSRASSWEAARSISLRL